MSSSSLSLSSLSSITHHRHRRQILAPSFCIKNSTNKKPPTSKPTSWLSPDWLTSLTKSVTTLGPKDDSNIPIASAKLEDVSDLLGGALFLPLFKWMNEYGPIYRLAAGPRNFVVVSDPDIAKHVLRNYGTTYAKGLVAEVSEFLFASGFAIAEGSLWTVRRRAVVPSLHKKYLSIIVERVFCRCAEQMVEKLKPYALNRSAVNMEEKFSQLTLDVIGLAIFNYNFDSLTSNSPVIDAVYTALKEAELRSTDLLPYWKAGYSSTRSNCTLSLSITIRIMLTFSSFFMQINALCKVIPRQIKAEKAVTLIRQTVEELIAKCREIVETEGERINEEEYVNDRDPSILRFLLASREEDPSSLRKAQEEVDRVLQGRLPTYEDIKNLKFLMRCITESMRLYPHPPVLLRRAQVADVLPGNYKVNAGQDIMISVYNIHHSAQVWERADEFVPERFDLEGPVPNETNTDYRFIPFSGGPRKCVGDQFALLEAIVALAVLLQHLSFDLVPDQNISMTTGATIHTTNGLYMKLTERQIASTFAAANS
ncbi:UNVERIFIED_CONTAM: Carotene epsilon-monooxygenase, chloroplastic [Sesamum radiatum]|uniref:Carotene epsilon-monooxygenase, chloroplastic n=1 Tax=Sesamum radiatum TaxID=300843 RepID=A0AAW2KUE3_SESRA